MERLHLIAADRQMLQKYFKKEFIPQIEMLPIVDIVQCDQILRYLVTLYSFWKYVAVCLVFG